MSNPTLGSIPIKKQPSKKTKPLLIGNRWKRVAANSALPKEFRLGASGSFSYPKLSASNQAARPAGSSPAAVLYLHHAIVGGGTKLTQIRELAHQLEMTEEELGYRCGISRSTLHRRKRKKESLSSAESDVLARHASLLNQATEVFEEEAAARNWLRTPQAGLGGQVPLDLALSTTGFREVEKLLTRIDQGVYA